MIFLVISLLFGLNLLISEFLILELILNKLVNQEDFKIQKGLLDISKVVQLMQMVRKLVLFLTKHQTLAQLLVIFSIFLIHKMTHSQAMILANKKFQFKYFGIKNNQDILVCKHK